MPGVANWSLERMKDVNTPTRPTAPPTPPPTIQVTLSSVPSPPQGLRMHMWNGLWGFQICPRSCHLPLSCTQWDLFQGPSLCPSPTATRLCSFTTSHLCVLPAPTLMIPIPLPDSPLPSDHFQMGLKLVHWIKSSILQSNTEGLAHPVPRYFSPLLSPTPTPSAPLLGSSQLQFLPASKIQPRCKLVALLPVFLLPSKWRQGAPAE